MKLFSTIILSLLFYSTLSAQDFSLNYFKGEVYKIPAKLKYRKFSEELISFPQVEEVYWKQLNFKQQNVEQGFPDMPILDCFGIMFTNQLTIKKSGYYRLSLTSDDGTILWLNDNKIISNDFSNGMHEKGDTLFLQSGELDLKIWYFQAYPTKMGLIFELDTVQQSFSKSDTLVFENKFLFKSNSSTLDEGAGSILDSLVQTLIDFDQVEIMIIGHTDNVGSIDFNHKLSKSRALSIKAYLDNKAIDPSFIINTKGMSFSQPIGPNETKEGRAKNRRVELFIKAYSSGK